MFLALREMLFCAHPIPSHERRVGAHVLAGRHHLRPHSRIG